MAALLDNVPTLHDQDDVSSPDGGEPVCDDEAGSAFSQGIDGTLYERLRASVDGTCGLVQNQDVRLRQEGPGNGQQLLLPCRDHGAFVGYLRAEAQGKRVHKVIDECRLAGSHEAHMRDIGDLRRPIADVVSNRPLTQPSVLQHHRDVATQRVPGQIVNLDCIVEHDLP